MRVWLAAVIVAAVAQSAAWAGDRTLMEAVKADDEDAALALLDEHADVNARESDGTTALHWAVYFNQPEVVRRLIDAGADVNAANEYGSTPMAEAAVVGNVDILRMLLEAGADVESANSDGQTALMVIARTSNIEAAKLLIDHGADVNAKETWRGQTALMWASAQGQPAMVELLIEHGARVDERSVVNNWQRQVTAEPRAQARPAGGFTALLYAARDGCLGCAKALVAAGADVNLADPEGVTPLIRATSNFHFDIAAHLLEHGADPNKWDWWGRTPLYQAVDLNTIPYGGRPDRPSLSTTTSLQLIQMLLEKGANPNARLKLFPPYRALGPDRGADRMLTIGTTPLLRAAKAGDAAAVELLLKHGALPNVPNVSGITPVMAAAGLDSNDIDTRGRFKTQEEAIATLKLLLAAGGDINAKGGRRDQTALHGAAYWGWNDVVQFLVDNNARLDAKDAKGMTPLDSAMGRAGGHGRGGQTIKVHEATAALIEKLMNRSARGPQASTHVRPQATTKAGS